MFGGPRFVGKSQILSDINETREDCSVSRVNFKLMRTKFKHLPNDQIWSLVDMNRSAHMIYKHTIYCRDVSKFVDNMMIAYGTDTRDLGKILRDVFNQGKFAMQLNKNIGTEQNIILLDVRKSYFRTHHYDRRLYFECVTYVALAFSRKSDPFLSMCTLYDKTDIDPALEYCGIYDHILVESTVNPFRYITKDKSFVEKRIVDLHLGSRTYL